MRRVIAVLVLLVLLVPAATTSAANPNKTGICHLNDEGNFVVISVANKSLPDHLSHGDQVIGVDVDENCEPLFPVGCFTWFYGDYILTNGQNPQLSVPVYDDSTCTTYLGVGPYYGAAWAENASEAQALCPGYSVYLSPTPNLYVCY